MAGRLPKVTAETWVETARQMLIEDGVAEIKIDRLAQRLGVTRGGFYHYFVDRDNLLAQLLNLWDTSCKFLPPEPSGHTFMDGGRWIIRTINRLIEEDGYDSAFDMAVREWARSDQRTAWAVERADRQRLSTLEAILKILGHSTEEARIRARVFYFHQIGFYALGIRESIPQRRQNSQLYTDILFGAELMRRVRAEQNE
ncbi:TetR/AcrR family transcriptional regulator [Brucella cytisi]|uniref:TetR/AcrR family transcriptional regulator n=1 Tax=Brucella cytisi TaxID=407152 RepID=UPI0035D56615